MTPQSATKQSTKTQVRRKRKLSSPTDMENDCNWIEPSSGFYMTRSKQDSTTPDSGYSNDDVTEKKCAKSKSLNDKDVVKKGAKKLKVSPKDDQSDISTCFPALDGIEKPPPSIEKPEGELEKKGTCEICNEDFKDLHSLTLHLRKNHVKDNVCKICNKTLSSTSSLDRHMLRHSKEKPYKCKYCGQSFTTNGNMNRHMHKHEESGHKYVNNAKNNKKNCLKLEKDCSLNLHDKEPLMEEEIKANEAPIIKSEFAENGESTAIIETEKNSDKTVEILLESHVENQTNNDEVELKFIERQTDFMVTEKFNEVDPYGAYICSINASVKGFHNLVYIPFSSPKFPIYAQRAYEESKLLNKDPPEHKCTNCERVFHDFLTFLFHEATHLPEYLRYCCPWCSRHCISEVDFQQHILNYHSNKWYKGKPLEKQSQKDTFYEQLGLCSKEKSIENNNCGAMPKLELNEEETEYYSQCDDENSSTIKERTNDNECPEVETINGSVEEHRHTENSNDFADIKSIISNVAVTPVTSEQSDTDRNSSSPDVMHKDSISDEINDNSDSSLGQDQPKDLNKHGFKKVSSQDRPLHPCTYSNCSYKSADKSSVARHLRTHTKEHPFQCITCGCKFTTKANGERHAKKKHQMSHPELSSVIVYNANMSNSGDNETVCKYCEVDFNNYRVLQHHYRSLSNSCRSKPFVCSKCNLGFATKNNYVRHYSNKHANKSKLLNSVKLEAAKFIVHNNSAKKKKTIQRKVISEDDTQDMTDNECQDINTCSSEIPSSPMSFQEKDNLFSDDDRVDAAESLVCLSQSTELQCFPLDLSVRALDLSGPNKLTCAQDMNGTFHSDESNFNFTGSFNRTPLSKDKIPISSTDMTNSEIEAYSSSRSSPVPLNLTKSQPNLYFQTVMPNFFPRASLPQDTSSNSTFKSSSSPDSHSIAPNNFVTPPQNNCAITSTPKPKAKGSNPKRIKCDFCESDFTLKANKDRHVRNQHPEHSRMPRSRSSPGSHQGNKVPKQTTSTICNSTKEALLTRVLQNTDSNKQHLEIDEALSEQLHSRSLIKSEETDNIHEVEANSDLENVDLASVSSVINTANSPRFKQYLTEDLNCHSITKNSTVTIPSNTRSGLTTDDGKNEDLKNAKANKHLCKVCGQLFQWGSGLQRHKVKHTGDKPYICPECLIRCTTKSNLSRHFRKKHGNLAPSYKNTFKLHGKSHCKDELSNTFIKTESKGNDLKDCSSLPFPKACVLHDNQKDAYQSFQEIAMVNSNSSNDATESLECNICNTTYKTTSDLCNHVKELHHIEYETMHGKTVNLPDIMTLWKRQ